jgi:stage II sporulation protein D
LSANRVKKNSFHILPLFLVMIFIIVISAALYFTLFRPSYINCGIFLEKRENENTIDVKLGIDDKVKWIKVSKRLGLPKALAYNVKLKGIVVSSISPCKSYSGKIYSYDPLKGRIELENSTKKLSPYIKYYQMNNKTIKPMASSSVIVGTESSHFIENDGMIAAVLVGKPDLNTIRVGLSTKVTKSHKHKDIIMYSKRIITLEFDHKSIQVKDYALGINYNNGFMEVVSFNENGKDVKFKALLGKTKNRIHIYSNYDFPVPISFKSIEKGDINKYVKDFPEYYGSLEFTIKNGAIDVINEVDVDTYADNVVSTKMSNLGDYPTAYSVQAVAARTFAVSEILSGKNAKYGFHIEDSMKDQSYNPEKLKKKPEEIAAAVAKTAGLVMTYDKKIIDAKYYSTSCGVGTPYNSIWYENNLPDKENPKPYLAYSNYSKFDLTDLSSETAATNFLKDWTIKAYDSNSKYFRWKYTIDFSSVSKLINENIYKNYLRNKHNYTKKWYFDIYRQANIHKNGIGKINDVSISKRGISGNVLELQIDSDTGIYRITKDTNIKRLLISKDIEVNFIFGSPTGGYTAPPSSFFVIDKETNINGNKIKALTIYGGGYGHGVGMSQYGVIGLIRDGKNYKEILKAYYKGIVFENYQNALNKYFD